MFHSAKATPRPTALQTHPSAAQRQRPPKATNGCATVQIRVGELAPSQRRAGIMSAWDGGPTMGAIARTSLSAKSHRCNLRGAAPPGAPPAQPCSSPAQPPAASTERHGAADRQFVPSGNRRMRPGAAAAVREAASGTPLGRRRHERRCRTAHSRRRQRRCITGCSEPAPSLGSHCWQLGSRPGRSLPAAGGQRQPGAGSRPAASHRRHGAGALRCQRARQVCRHSRNL